VNKQGNTVYQVFVDGACSNNGPDAKAGYGLYFGENNPWNVAASVMGTVHTSQRAELQAIMKAYQVIEKKDNGHSYEIMSDSSYAINCLTKWRHDWKKNGWKTSEGKPVENVDLIQDCIKIMDRLVKRGIALKKVQAHGDSKGNKRADVLARQGVQVARGHVGGNDASKSWSVLGLSPVSK
jgi:ribonuclease HI